MNEAWRFGLDPDRMYFAIRNQANLLFRNTRIRHELYVFRRRVEWKLELKIFRMVRDQESLEQQERFTRD